jgi:hypothetical protein
MCEYDLEGFNYGYRDGNSEFRNVMACTCHVCQCDNLTMDGVDRVQRFSNNETLFNGKPTGDNRNKNATVLNDARSIVAAMDCRKKPVRRSKQCARLTAGRGRTTI